jgi:YHS domain-containing protein
MIIGATIACEREPARVKPVEQQQTAMPAPMPMPAQAGELPRVPAGAKVVAIGERDKVCMVNDQYMGRTQIPVSVQGQTYFGCCKMCKERLEQDGRLRTGVDPVSGRPVDKASAVIGMQASGDVLYFENESSLKKYNGA